MRTRSHQYDFTFKDVLRVLAPPLVPLLLFASALHLGALSKILPAPAPALDTDRTIMLHQAEASRRAHHANVILIGDSSCLMDVAATQLTEALGSTNEVLNLGTLSFLDLHSFAAMLRNYVQANPGRVSLVVLLMNPEALRRPAPTEYNVEALAHFYAETDYCVPTMSKVLCGLGVETFRGRVLSRTIPIALPGAFGQYYGFTHDLWRHLDEHRGSAIDPGRFDPATAQGNAEYRLAANLERASQSFRSVVPPGATLCVGITPLPQSFVRPAHQQLHGRMLDTWRQWLKADVALTDLPATMPDSLFASTTHLNPEGVRLYTEQLSRLVQAHAATDIP